MLSKFLVIQNMIGDFHEHFVNKLIFRNDSCLIQEFLNLESELAKDAHRKMIKTCLMEGVKTSVV